MTSPTQNSVAQNWHTVVPQDSHTQPQKREEGGSVPGLLLSRDASPPGHPLEDRGPQATRHLGPGAGGVSLNPASGFESVS